MIPKIIDNFYNLDKKIYKIMKYGVKFCFVLCLISCIILLTYLTFIKSPNIYYVGIAFFRLSLYFIVEFIVCGFVVDNIK